MADEAPRPGSGCLLMVRVRFLLWVFALGLGPSAAPAANQAAEGTLSAAPSGWLDLGRDQRAYRERVGPLSPTEDADLRRMERRQALDQQALEQRQRQQRQRLQDSGAGAATGPGLHQQQRREVDEQRLDWRIEREVLGR